MFHIIKQKSKAVLLPPCRRQGGIAPTHSWPWH